MMMMMMYLKGTFALLDVLGGAQDGPAQSCGLVCSGM